MDVGVPPPRHRRSSYHRSSGKEEDAYHREGETLVAQEETARNWLVETARLRPFMFYLCKKTEFFNAINFFTLTTAVWVALMSVIALMLITDVIHLDSDNRGWMSLVASAVSVALLGLCAVSIVHYWEWYARISHRHLLAVATPTVRATAVLFFAFLGVAIINTKYGGHAGVDDDDDLKFDDDDYWTDDKVRGKTAEQIVLCLLVLATPILTDVVAASVVAHVMPECKTSPIEFRDRVEAGRPMPTSKKKSSNNKKKRARGRAHNV